MWSSSVKAPTGACARSCSQPGSRIVGSTAYEPERYGEKLIPLALKILRGEPVPPAVYMEHTFVRAMPESENV